MKKTSLTLFGLFLSLLIFTQSPEGFKYQAVVRNSSGAVVANQTVGLQIRLRQTTATGTPIYEESFIPTSNGYGLVNITIGAGTVTLGTFANIDWSVGPYFVEIGMDITGGTGYTVMGTSQLMSVPYALYAKTAANAGVNYTSGTGISLTGNVITNTAPDQPVTFLGTGATTVTGTYPNFTINSTDNVNDADSDSTNEIQDISLVGDSLIISNGSTINLANITNSNSWSTTGNAGTDTSNFIGTTDNKDVVFMVNNVRAGLLNASNTSFGVYALNPLNTSTENTATGYYSLYSNTTGSGNSATGSSALYSNTTGVGNVANGKYALYMNDIGYSNVATGYRSLFSNTSGFRNTAIGSEALESNNSGFWNTAIGGAALISTETGSYNTGIGYYAYSYNPPDSNGTAIGYNALSTASNQIRLGNSVVNSIGGFSNWTNVSDARFKKDIKENVVGLDFILKLRPVTYHLDMDAIADKLNTPDSLRMPRAEQQKGRILQTGFIAQEVEKIAQKLGYDFSGVDAPKNENDYYGIRYAEFVVPLVKGMQEQQKIIETQQKEIDELKRLVKQLLSK